MSAVWLQEWLLFWKPTESATMTLTKDSSKSEAMNSVEAAV